MFFTTLKSRRASFTGTSAGKKISLEWFYMKLSQVNYHFKFTHSVNIKAFK